MGVLPVPFIVPHSGEEERMAKRGEGIPIPKASKEKRHHLSRAEREQRINSIVLAGTGVLVAVVVVLVVVGIAYEAVIKPNEPVAIIGDFRVSTTDFQQRVRWQRIDTLLRLNQAASIFGLTCETADAQSPIYADCQQIQYPSAMGNAVLNAIIDEQMIRQEAAERRLTVSEEEVQERINEYFRFNPSAEPPTPSPEPSATPTRRFTATPSPTPTATVTPTGTVTPPATATPVGEPSATPTAIPTLTLEEQRQQFADNYAVQLALVSKLAGVTEAQYRERFANEVLREKVKESLTAVIPAVVDQVHLRQVRVQTEQEAIELLEALRDGESFAALARNADSVREANDPNRFQGGDMGWVPRESLPFRVADAAFEAEIGAVLGPIQDTDLRAAQQGQPADFYYVIQVLGHEVRELDADTLQQQRDEFFNTWLSGQRGKAETFTYWRERVPDEPTEEQVFAELQKLLPTPTNTPEVTAEATTEAAGGQ